MNAARMPSRQPSAQTQGASARTRLCPSARTRSLQQPTRHRNQQAACPRSRQRALSVTAFQGSTTSTTTSTTSSASAAAQEAVKQKLTVSWAGAGIFFFWQLGAMKFLAQQYDLTKVPMVGASGGSLAAVLAACGVNADSVIKKAYDLSIEKGAWVRPTALLGIWGKLIEQWLDALLPDNAHELCRGRITVVVTTLPNWQQVGINDFKDKKDLINACMASSHVPFVLDYRLTRTCRGKQCVDGSFPDFFTGLNSELLRSPAGGQAVIFDYFDDKSLKRNGRLDMLEVKSYDEIQTLYRLGYEYAAKLHEQGKFSQFELAEVLLQGEGGQISEVLVPEHSGVFLGQQSGGVPPTTAQAAAAVSGAHGLVLELQQDTQELVDGLQEGQQHHLQQQQQQQQVLKQAKQAAGTASRIKQ